MFSAARKLISRALQAWPDHDLPGDIDFLVYSSHKTGTQTVLATLNNSGMRARHFHIMDNVRMQPGEGDFRTYLEHYRRTNRQKLTVISIFRLPWERHMSSFFQWHAEGVVREGHASRTKDTIIARCAVDELQGIFLQQIQDGSLRGREDSLLELCSELDYEVSTLSFDEENGFHVFEDELMRLLLFRFDLLFPGFHGTLEDALQTELSPQIDNRSDDKWYAEKFTDFKTTLAAPPDLIRGVHGAKKELIDVFYPLQYQLIVDDHIARYGLADTGESAEQSRIHGIARGRSGLM